MSANQIIGTRGYIALFEGFLYKKVRKACKNIVIKIFVHSIGLMLMIIGMYFLINFFTSMIGAGGLLLMFIGFVVYMTPFGA